MKTHAAGAALLAIVVVAQTSGGAVRSLFRLAEHGPTLHVGCSADHAECGAALQAAIDRASPGTTITLDAGKVYEASLVVQPRPGASQERPLTITTKGWSGKGTGWDGLVTPADKPRLATLRGSPRSTAAVAVMNGDHAGFVTLTGLAIEATPPEGHGDLIRIGSGDAQAIGEVPAHVVVRQVLLQGDRQFGQRRGIAANGVDIRIEQVWCEEIFTPGQDSQCVGAWNAGQRVQVRHSYLAAGAENLMIGGAPIPSPEMQPREWLIEDVILHKPLRWRQDGRNRQIKNLLEFKHGRQITVRRVLAVNNWRAAQDGRGLLIHFTTNGRCPACGNLEQIVIEDFVMLNVDGGVSFQGYSWQPDSFSRGKLRDVQLRNLYVQIAGSGRAIQIANVLGPHDLSIERSTFLNGGSSWIMASVGRAWRDDMSVGDGGAMQGLRVVDSVFTANGDYGITAPDGRHFGSGIADFVSDRLQIAGNVIGDAPREHLHRYNDHQGTGSANVAAAREAMLAKLAGPACREWTAGKGAECSRLEPVFAGMRRLPEP